MCLLAATMVFAQRSKGGGGSKGPDIPQGGFATSRLDRVATMLALDKDQKKELKTTFDEAQKEAQPLHDQISKARLAVAEAVAGGKTPDEIGKACTDEAQLEAQMTEIELKAFTKFAVSLTPEQRPKASALFSMMRGLFAGKNWNEAQ
jgi:Spy/CpxP family protein refolding chaperone